MIRRVFEVEWLFIVSQLNCDSLGVNRNDAINCRGAWRKALSDF